MGLFEQLCVTSFCLCAESFEKSFCVFVSRLLNFRGGEIVMNVIAAFLIAMATVFVAVDANALGTLFGIAATVDGQAITHYDVSQRAKQIAVERGGQEDSYREVALEEIISETIIRNAALSAGYSVSKREIKDSLLEMAESSGVTPEELVGFFASRGVRFESIMWGVESRLLEKKYIFEKFGEKVKETVLKKDVALDLQEYERNQWLELKLERISFGLLYEDGLKEVRNLQARIVKAMDEKGMSFAEIGAEVASSSSGVHYSNLGWRSEQIFRDPRLIELMISLKDGSTTPPLSIGSQGVSIFYVQEKRIRTLAGVEPFHFDIAFLSIESPADASKEQIEASIQRLRDIRDVGAVCSGTVALPEGVYRRPRKGDDH